MEDPRLLTAEEIALLTPEEKEQYEAELLAYERQLDREDAAKDLLDLATFQRKAWTIVEPETVLSWSWHYDFLCEWLTLVADGRFKQQHPELLGLLIQVPPRTGKSTFSTINFPCWLWTKFPARRFLFSSHSSSLAIEHNRKRRFLIDSPWYQELFGSRFRLTGAGTHQVVNDHTGVFIVSSVGSKHTGKGGDICIGDDLLDRLDQFSNAAKSRTNKWLDASFNKMLNDRRTGVFIHISQRLAVDDPTGHLLGEDQPPSPATERLKAQWKLISIKRQAEEDEEYLFPISGHVHRRKKGDVLDEPRCPPFVLVDLQSKSREWANQEQQRPTPATGAILNPNWMRWYRASDPLPAMSQVIVSVDCTFKAGDGTDMVAIHKYGLVSKRRYLLDRETKRLNYPSTKAAIKAMSQGGHKVLWLREPMPAATQVLIENKANGPATIDDLRGDPNFPLAVIEYEPGQSSKTERFTTATSDAEAGLCYFPEDAPWMGQVRKILTDYAGEGSVPFDDDCDAWSQTVNWSRGHRYGLLDYLEGLEAAAAGIKKGPTRCVVEDVDGSDLILEWDEQHGDWFDPKNPERRFQPEADGDDQAKASAADGAAGSSEAAEDSEAASHQKAGD